MAAGRRSWVGLRVISTRSVQRPLPVILPALPDELLSSWIRRHALYYGVGERPMLRHCILDAPSLRHLDLDLSVDDQHRLGDVFRCGARAVRKMTQSRNGRRPQGPIATVSPMQVCRQCAARHRAAEITRGARLRSWMEGWRISCPVCGARLENARPMDLLMSVDEAEPLLVSAAEHARRGELLIDTGLRKPGQAAVFLIELMRSLLLPRLTEPENRQRRTTIPRLLDIVVPGFDKYLQLHYPCYRSPSSKLLAISVRVPVLAGVSAVSMQPDYWGDRLLEAAAKDAQETLRACLPKLPGSERNWTRWPAPSPHQRAWRPDVPGTRNSQVMQQH